MKKRYRSRIGVELVLLITAVLGFVSVQLILNHEWNGLIVILIVAVLCAYLFGSIYYMTDGDHLIIGCSFLFKMRINIDQIKSIRETNNPLSSPAASLDRLGIYYGKSGFVMVSPKDKSGFINELKSINPGIEVILKARKGKQS